MSKPWPTVKLADIMVERREVPSSDDLTLGRLRIVSKIRFDSGRLEYRSNSETNTEMILARPGDLVVSGINAAKGAIAIYGSENQEPVAATIHYAAYTPNSELADINFLWWFMRSQPFREILAHHVPGGIKTELKPKRLLPLAVPLPNLSEQRWLVQRLVEIDASIREAKRMRSDAAELIDGQVESAIEAWMRPASAKGQIGDVLALKPRSGPAFVTNPDWTGTPVLMPSSVSGFGVNISKIEFGIGGERIAQLDRLEAGDILIARGNKRDQVGNAGVVPASARGWVGANLLMRMKTKPDKADPDFLVYWLRSPSMRNLVYRSMSGTNPNIQKINQAKILRFPFPTQFSVPEQRRIVAELDALQSEVDGLKRLQAESAKELDALMPSILDKAFKGEL